ncbi:MAG: hypothetical protein QOE03_2611 [Micromonosporaceae bacterium]|nr:hypothetical protein [Micromonosporaceae bacterium]
MSKCRKMHWDNVVNPCPDYRGGYVHALREMCSAEPAVLSIARLPGPDLAALVEPVARDPISHK